jgi:hypothetical protein
MKSPLFSQVHAEIASLGVFQLIVIAIFDPHRLHMTSRLEDDEFIF